MDNIALARVLHVLAVILWIGGVSMATTVALPAVQRGALGADRLRAFQAFEGRFVWQARGAVIVVGLTGLYMIVRLGPVGSASPMPASGGCDAMVCLWALFAFLLFIGRSRLSFTVSSPLGGA